LVLSEPTIAPVLAMVGRLDVAAEIAAIDLGALALATESYLNADQPPFRIRSASAVFVKPDGIVNLAPSAAALLPLKRSFTPGTIANDPPEAIVINLGSR
jgi:hypothetical protein